MTKTQKNKLELATRSTRISMWNFIFTSVISAAALVYTIWHNHSESKDIATRLGKFEATIRILTASVAPQLEHEVDETLKAATLSSTDRANELAKGAQQNLDVLRELKAPVTAELSEQLVSSSSALLTSHPDLPVSWNVAAQLISYRSDFISQPPSLPNCFDIEQDSSIHRTNAEKTYSHCLFDLNDIAGANRKPIVLTQNQGSGQIAQGILVPKYLLVDVVVVYSGGPIIPFDKIECKNCKLDFRPGLNVPSPSGQKVIRTLLASAPDHFVVTESEQHS